MAITVTKVTYSLKPETVDRVQELAAKWNVPRSEVVRRAIDRVAMEEGVEEEKLTPLQAFERLQKTGISAKAAAKYNAEVRRERRASSLKRG